MLHPSPANASTDIHANDRLTKLELENAHLQQLVAELLIKNHQLRTRQCHLLSVSHSERNEVE